MTFIAAMENMLDERYNVSFTQNDAKGFNTSGKELLDLNYNVAQLRHCDEDIIVQRFLSAYRENAELAFKWLFFSRDVRGGLGERRLFRVIIKFLAQHSKFQQDLLPVIKYIPEYGRWDDLFTLLTPDIPKNIQDLVLEIIVQQLVRDGLNMMMSDNPISLLGKWLPSVQSKNPDKQYIVRRVRKKIGLSEREYRRALSTLRAYLGVTEVKMCANQWDDIDYSQVPSKANLLYKNAFLKHDCERRKQFLQDVEEGVVTINSSVVFPHDIVGKYMCDWGHSTKEYDATLERMWENLPDLSQSTDNTIVVADGSGSMVETYSKYSTVTLLDIANGLAIYFAEHSSGQFKDKYITFSENPQIVDLSYCDSLKGKIDCALAHDEIANTNIEAVFDLILQTAVRGNMTQEDLPKNILIISDMEFDDMVEGEVDKRLFEQIEAAYVSKGFKVPRLIFWNLGCGSGTIPVKENDEGVALVSGFSLSIAEMVLSNKIDPYACLIEKLTSERYALITLER